MNRVLVDANVLLDVLTDDPRWYGWSADQLDACAARAHGAIEGMALLTRDAGRYRICYPKLELISP